jgi:hypothetical protein
MQAGEKGLEVRNLIGGRWEERDGRDTEPVYDPATHPSRQKTTSTAP